MQAVMKIAPGVGNVTLGTIDVPAVTPEHVIIEVAYAGICGTDLHIYHDEFRTTPPVVMGHEIAGRIVEVGAGVTDISVGMRVTSETYYHTCQQCRHCRNGRPNLCLQRKSIGSAVHGGFTRYVRVPATNIHQIPANVSDQAAALTEPLACVVNAIDLSRITPGDIAVIAGPGAIGMLTLQVLVAAGAQVIMLGTPAARLAIARQLGAAHTIDISTSDVAQHIDLITEGLGADIVLECAGAGAAAHQLLQLVRRGGRYTQIGLFGKPIAWDMDQVCYKELIVTGSNASVPHAWDRALRLIASGQVNTHAIVSAIYPISAWHQAFAEFEAKQGLKILLTPLPD
ncbi:MAG: alcohol dehydrogenase [Chloroflexia bacterium]|nr:alcohol dehydrogenase [Chloroflexia bacterium]